MSQSAFRVWADVAESEVSTMAASMSIFDDEKDTDDSEDESQSECYVEMNTFDPSQATFFQAITDCKEE